LVPGTTSECEESRAHCCTPRSSHGWKTSGWPFMTSAAETGGSVLCTELCTWLGLGLGLGFGLGLGLGLGFGFGFGFGLGLVHLDAARALRDEAREVADEVVRGLHHDPAEALALLGFGHEVRANLRVVTLTLTLTLTLGLTLTLTLTLTCSGSAMRLASHRFFRWLGPPPVERMRFQSVQPMALVRGRGSSGRGSGRGRGRVVTQP